MEHTIATVINTVRETSDVWSIYFTVNNKILSFTAGQYITVYFDDTGITSGKAYSLSSCPGARFMRITVKRIGLFSGRICELKIGDHLAISQPYGFFNTASSQPTIALAASVGIAPIWSMIQDQPTHQVRLLYSNKTNASTVFYHELDTFAATNPNCTVDFFLTQERSKDNACFERRISIDQDTTPEERAACMFYICGSVGFVTDMWQQLTNYGVNERSISTETFFEV